MERPASLIAQEHWDWVATWLRMVYIDAFVHGYKHGTENPQSTVMITREELEKAIGGA